MTNNKQTNTISSIFACNGDIFEVKKNFHTNGIYLADCWHECAFR